MKKLLCILVFLLSRDLYAASLTAITSSLQERSQNISFNFADKAILPQTFVSGNNLVIDFYNTNNASKEQQFKFNKGFLKEVDIVEANSRVRAILVGGASARYTMELNGKAIVFEFVNSSVKQTVLLGKVGIFNSAKALPDGYTVNVNSVKFNRDDNGGGIVELTYSGSAQIDYQDNRVGDNLVINLNGIGYNKSILKNLDTTDFDVPIKYIDIQPTDTGIKLVVQNKGNWDYAIYQLENRILVNIRKVVKDDSGIPDLNAGKSDKVSFNFQNIEVRSLLQLLADFSGYNILVSDQVTGTISLKLNNVPWDYALNLILTTKGLGMKRDGNVIRIATINEISALNKQQLDTQKSQEAIETLETATIRLKYTKAATVQTMLQKPFGTDKTNKPTSLLSARGTILVDDRTNTIIINDVPSHLKDIQALIDKIDIPVKQVLIEARIVEANSNFAQNLGTNLLIAGVNGSNITTNTLTNGININQSGMSSLNNTYVNTNSWGGSGTTPSIATIFAPNSSTLIGLEVDAVELQGQGKTISSPKVMTANYQAANIQQGVQIPYQQSAGGVSGATTIAFINAVLSLQVTPQVTDDGNIVLDVNIHKDTPSQTLQVLGTPAINTNSVTTRVQVQDGSTILVGGIYLADQSFTEQKVPLLGDIPYLGWLFKTTAQTSNKQELLIFITPRIINNELNNDIP